MRNLIERLCIAGLLLVGFFSAVPMQSAESLSKLTGRVTAAGKPVHDVLVTDGNRFVKTDAKGCYAFESNKADGFVYIVTPNNYVARSEDGLTPQFWRELDKKSRNENHDFELNYEDQSHAAVLLMSDLHLCNSTKKHDLDNFRKMALPVLCKTIAEQKANGPVYTLQLGDFTHDVYWYEFNFNELAGKKFFIDEKYPSLMYSIPGNHDNDGAIRGPHTDRRAEWAYRKAFGPTYYSMNIGGVHWLMLDDVVYLNTRERGQTTFKGVGIVGNRNYRAAFTDDEMDWVMKDLAQVDAKTPVRLCMHIPPIAVSDGMVRFPQKQMDSLYAALKRFGDYRLYNGHLHKMQFLESSLYPGFTEYVIPALSGNMWEHSDDFQTIGLDGGAAGFVVEHIDNAKMTPQFVSIEFPNKLMRIYDMNEVAKYYRNEPLVRKQIEMEPRFPDYAQPQYANQLMVNYWFAQPGDKVEAFEGGRPLAVVQQNLEDPLWNMEQYVDKLRRNANISYSVSELDTRHIWMVQALTSDSPVTVRVTDSVGKVVAEETVQRPKAFNKDIK